MENQTIFFNKNERRGILALGILILLIINLPSLHRWMIQDEIPEWQEIQTTPKEVSIRAEVEIPKSSPTANQRSVSKKTNPKIKKKEVKQKSQSFHSNKSKESKNTYSKPKVFDFDPNHLTKDSLLLLGLSSFAVRNLIKYRNGGGSFSKKEDLKKIYGLDSLDFNRIKDRIKIRRKAKPKKAKPKASKLFINAADSAQWTELKGIGPYYAKKITQYREKLGGFYAVEQVAETWALPDSTFQKIKPYLLLDAGLQPFDINRISGDELAKHPYISFKKARIICNYIQQNGKIKNEQDLYAIRALDSFEIKKILPYIDFPSEDLSLK